MLKLAILGKPYFAQVVFVFCLKIKRGHVIKDDRNGFEYFFGVLIGDSLYSFFVFALQHIQKSINGVLVNDDPLVTLEIIKRLQFVGWVGKTRYVRLL